MRLPVLLLFTGGETRNRGTEPSHPGSMGDRQVVAQVRAQTRPGSVRRSMGRLMEQHDTRGHQNAETRHYGSQGFPCRGSDHEEVATREAYPAIRCLYHGGADLHYHGAYEEWKLARVLARYFASLPAFVFIIFIYFCFSRKNIYRA